MDELPDRTLDADAAQPSVARGAGAEAHLFVGLECDRPAARSTRHYLGPGGTALLGRGRERGVDRGGDHRGTRLDVRIPDKRMSSEHARLDGVRGEWRVTDLGSRNGVRVNGCVVDEAALADGDVIELGHTMLLFKNVVPVALVPDVDLGAAGARPTQLLTLSPSLSAQFEKLDKLANANVAILILGETGTGKEVVARAVHQMAADRDPFIGVNCGAIPKSLVEGELFGSAKGAFSGAVADRTGLVREADGGTLFLDEVGDLPAASQSAFLRVLQERKVRPVGGTQSFPVDIRLTSATNQDLEQLVRAGLFRSDLFARVAGYRLTLPPLRERREDMGLLVATLIERIAPARAPGAALTLAAARRLYQYDFPLNIRELETWLTAALALSEDGPIDLKHLPEPLDFAETVAASQRSPLSDRRPGAPRPLTIDQQKHRKELEGLLKEHGGNVSAVARQTGKARNQIQRWLRRYALEPNDYR